MKETILIVEDEEDILALLSSLLESEGYHIITASNGREGIAMFQEHNPDLVLTDVRMPVMDGIEVLREIKAKESDTEVIILTGHSDEATAIDCLRLGAYDYFCKPLEDIDVLFTAVERVLEKRSLELKNRSLVKQLEELSIRDSLTGLYNYRHLQACLDDEINRSRRYDHSFFILMIDADHFKDVNDTCGHLFGDYVLKKLGDLIAGELRSTDRLFRYGGEEFLAIMNEISKSEVVKVVNRQMAAIRNHTFKYEDQKAKVTVSMGGAFFPEDAQNKVSLVREADQALYRAKEAGRDRFECCFELPVEVSEQSLKQLKNTAVHDLSKAASSN
ncbi:MAG: diguanylate cyclase [Desulfobacterales bacterium]